MLSFLNAWLLGAIIDELDDKRLFFRLIYLTYNYSIYSKKDKLL